MKALLLALLLLATGQAIHAANIVAEPFPPARFINLYIEKDDTGTSISFQAVGDTVIYSVNSGGKVVENVTAHPTDDDWFKFIQALNAAKVYQWAPKYYYPGQGPTWVIDATMEDRKFNSEGTNEYPLAGNEAQPQANPGSGPSIPFQLFWQAALTLVGKAPPAAPTK